MARKKCCAAQWRGRGGGVEGASAVESGILLGYRELTSTPAHTNHLEWSAERVGSIGSSR